MEESTKYCPKCGRPMTFHKSKYGGYFWGCSGYKDGSCKYTENCDENGNPIPRQYNKAAPKQAQQNAQGKTGPIIAKDGICPECGSKMQLRTSKSGKEYLWCKACKSMYFKNSRGNWQKWSPKENNNTGNYNSQHTQSPQNSQENTRPASSDYDLYF